MHPAENGALHWFLQPANQWDLFKFLVPLVMLLVGWAWRVEKTLARHDMMHDRQTETLAKVEKLLADWTQVKEDRASRLAVVEAKLDLLLAQVGAQAAGGGRSRTP
jgi:hypothetical protein